MLTKIEQVREANGESDARKVFDMPTDEEALYYVVQQKKAELVRAERDAKTTIKFIENYRLRWGGKAAMALWQKPNLYTLANKYSIHSTMQDFFVDMVHEYFKARVEYAKAYKAAGLI